MTAIKYLSGLGHDSQISIGVTSSAARTRARCGALSCSLRWRRIIFLVLCAFLISATPATLRGQQALKDPPAGVGNLRSAEVTGDTLTLRVGEDTIVVQIAAPNIRGVHYHRENQTSPATPVLDPSHTWRN